MQHFEAEIKAAGNGGFLQPRTNDPGDDGGFWNLTTEPVFLK